jgi:hypothetical protein
MAFFTRPQPPKAPKAPDPAAGGEWAGPRKEQPFLLLSVGLHLALLGLLHNHAKEARQPLPTAQRQVQVTAALEQARRQQMQRQVRAMQDMQRKLAQQMADAADAPEPEVPGQKTALPDDPKALLQQAQKLADAMQRTEQKARAAELSRLQKITPQAALEKVKAEDLKRAPPAAQDQRLSVAQLEQQAKETVQRLQDRQAQQQAQQQQGVPVQAEKIPLEKPGQERATDRRAEDGKQTAKAEPSKSADRGGSTGQGPLAGKPGSSSNSSSGSGGQGSSSNAQTGGQGGVVSAGSGFRDPRYYDGLAVATAVDATTLRPGEGRVLAAGGPLATRLYLNSWYIAGPFAAAGSNSLNEIYPPEHDMKQGIDLDAAYEGMGQRVLQWQPQTSSSYPFVPQPRAENSVYYAYTELRVDTAQEVWLEIGADDDTKLWLNNELVWTSGTSDKPWYRQPFYRLGTPIKTLNLVEGRRRVWLKPGRNTLMLKLYNGIDLMFFAVVVTP